MAVMQALILDGEAVAKAAALFVDLYDKKVNRYSKEDMGGEIKYAKVLKIRIFGDSYIVRDRGGK